MPVGGLGVGGVAGRGLGELGGEEGVVGVSGESLRASRSSALASAGGILRQGGRELARRGRGGGVTGGEFRGGQEGVAGVVESSGAGEEEAEGDLRLGEGGVVGDGGAVALFGGGGLVEGVLGGAEIVEQAGVLGLVSASGVRSLRARSKSWASRAALACWRWVDWGEACVWTSVLKS